MIRAASTLRRLPPQSGTAFVMPRGAFLTIVDPEGEQVADLIAFAHDHRADVLSSGRTLDYNATLRLTTGHVLYSAASHPMFTITEDTVGRHDFLLSPCSLDMFRILYRHHGPHPSCFDNLAQVLAEFDIAATAIPTTFNAFMHVDVAPSGALRVLPPLSRAGDRMRLRAEMDLVVGLTACSAELSNNGRFKPIDYEVSA